MTRYGVKYSAQSKEIRNKIESTNLLRYGFKCAFKNKDVHNKFVTNFMQKYGVENPSQSEEIRDKTRKTSFRVKKYTFKDGKMVFVQGYEPLALQILEELNYSVSDIAVTYADGLPSIKYFFEEKNRTYHPDIFIKSEHKLIEVKSTWTCSRDLEQNLKKQEACLEQGYNFEFWILDGKGNRIDPHTLH